MNISLDYDDTFTKDPDLWLAFVAYAKCKGHKVYCVTMRYPQEGSDVHRDLTGVVDNIFFTCRQAKMSYMYAQGIHIDVWIDDSPNWIMTSAAS